MTTITCIPPQISLVTIATRVAMAIRSIVDTAQPLSLECQEVCPNTTIIDGLLNSQVMSQNWQVDKHKTVPQIIKL